MRVLRFQVHREVQLSGLKLGRRWTATNIVTISVGREGSIVVLASPLFMFLAKAQPGVHVLVGIFHQFI